MVQLPPDDQPGIPAQSSCLEPSLHLLPLLPAQLPCCPPQEAAEIGRAWLGGGLPLPQSWKWEGEQVLMKVLHAFLTDLL